MKSMMMEKEMQMKEMMMEMDREDRPMSESMEDDESREDEMDRMMMGEEMSALGNLFYLMVRRAFEELRYLEEEDLKNVVRAMNMPSAVEYDCLGEDYFAKVSCESVEGCNMCNREERMEVFKTGVCMEEMSEEEKE